MKTWQKHGKCSLAIFCSTILVLTSLLVGISTLTSAQTLAEMLYDGETLPTTQNIGTYSLDSSIKTEGKNSLKIVQRGSDGYVDFLTELDKGIAAADCDTLQFDIRIEHPFQTAGYARYFYVTLDGVNYVDFGCSGGYLFGNPYSSEWFTSGSFVTMTFDLSKFAATSVITHFGIRMVDENQAHFGQIANNEAINTLYIDNVRVEGVKKVVTQLYDGENLPEAQTIGTYSLDSTYKTEGANSLKIVQRTSDGYVDFLTELDKGIAAADCETLQFDIRMEHPYDIRFAGSNVRSVLYGNTFGRKKPIIIVESGASIKGGDA